MRINDRIKQARLNMKMSQDDLADAIGASRVTISKYENGHFLPSVTALQRIAAALGTTPAALTGESETPSPFSPEVAELVSLARKSDPAAIRAASAVLRALIADNEETKKA